MLKPAGGSASVAKSSVFEVPAADTPTEIDGSAKELLMDFIPFPRFRLALH
jgi:hypothetical protein